MTSYANQNSQGGADLQLIACRHTKPTMATRVATAFGSDTQLVAVLGQDLLPPLAVKGCKHSSSDATVSRCPSLASGPGF